MVVISTANGLKFAEQKARYHQDETERVTPRFANLPVEVAADIAVVRDAIARHVDRFGSSVWRSAQRIPS